MLFTAMSRPGSSEGAGSPRVGQDEGACVLPHGDEVWRSFWIAEEEEKPIRTAIFFPPVCARDSSRSESANMSRDGEAAQKQVEKRTECCALAMAAARDCVTERPVPMWMVRGMEVVRRSDGGRIVSEGLEESVRVARKSVRRSAWRDESVRFCAEREVR